ncbi:MAG: hypothetical protein IQL11_00935, partial [Bacteroidales bacterium]|nr:hypothetical protein [Bacteroidales bacterium]
MNYSPEFAFTVPIKIDDTLPNQNEAKHKSKNADIPVYQIPLKQPAIDLRFIPEGGKYIYGIQQRLAFSVIALTDRGLEISGVIINQKGVKITEFKSNSYGQGVIEFTPLLNDSYYAILIGEEFSGLEWVLPSPENSGVAMRVNNDGNGLIDIILKG